MIKDQGKREQKYRILYRFILPKSYI